MILLVSTSDKLQVISGQAVTVDVHASYIDYDGASVFSGGRKNTAISSATTTDVVAAPGSSVTRNIKTLHIRNKHATSAVDITVQHTDGTTVIELHKLTLAAQEMLQYIEGVGFFKVSPIAAAPLPNANATDQTINAATTAYLVGSALAIPTSRPMKVGTMFRWTLSWSKTGAGVAASAFDVRVGTGGSTGDTSRGTLATGTPTGVIDTAFALVTAIVRGPIGAACVLQSALVMTHNLQITGMANIPSVVVGAVSAGFDSTVAATIVGLSCTTGAASVWTFQQVAAEALNL